MKLIGFTLYCNSYVKVTRKQSDNNNNDNNNNNQENTGLQENTRPGNTGLMLSEGVSSHKERDSL